jgi:hypothetical protein
LPSRVTEHVEPVALAVIFIDCDRRADPLPDRRGGSAASVVENVRRPASQEQDIAGLQRAGRVALVPLQDGRAGKDDVVGNFTRSGRCIVESPRRREEAAVFGAAVDRHYFPQAA